MGGHESSQSGVPEQMKIRLAKRERLLAAGADPYPVGFPRTHTIAEAVSYTHLTLPTILLV